MVDDWLMFSLISIAIWGVWGIFGKIATNYLGWKEVFMISGMGAILVYLSFYIIARPSIDLSNKGFYFAFLAGLTVAGSITFYLALSQAKASLVVPLTALYPVVTIILAFLILKEKIVLTQGLGITFALIAILLLSLK